MSKQLDSELIGVTWGQWHKEPCHECGDEGYATRTQGCKAYRYLCDECETWDRAERQFDNERTELRQEIKELRTENERLSQAGVRSSRDRYLDMIGL